MKIEQMANHLALEFLVKQYEWQFPDGKRIPSEADILEGLEHAQEILEDGSSVFMGRLVISKSEGHTDVYLHEGEINV